MMKLSEEYAVAVLRIFRWKTYHRFFFPE